jgi:hypothetical protein
MSVKLIKTTGIICLSILLLFSGVAWALQNCLGEAIRHGADEHAESAIATTEGFELILATFLHSPHQPREKVHCVESRHLMGTMGQPSSVFRLATSGEGILLKSSFSSDSASSRETKTVWLAALSSLGLLRHLLLSILRI